MSNSAIIELTSVNLPSLGQFSIIEDNFGKAVHIHLGEIHLDITINELRSMANEMRYIINEFMCNENVAGFDCNMYDPLFLKQIAEYLPELEHCEIVTKKIKDLCTAVDKPYRGLEFRPLSDSRVTRALNGHTKEDDIAKQENPFGMTNHDRTLYIHKSIRENGYPRNNEYAVIFNNQDYVRDGQHRLSSVGLLYGDETEVPLIRMVFKNNIYNINKYPRLSYILHWDRKRIRNVLRKAKDMLKGVIK